MVDQYIYINHLIYSEKVTVSDAIVILEGDGYERLQTAASLILNRISTNLVFSGGINKPEVGSFPFEMCKEQLFALIGSANCTIHLEDKSMHTRDQAVNVIKMAKKYSWKSLVLVASQYHQIRAFLTFLKVLDEEGLSNIIILKNQPVLGQTWFEELPWGNRFQLLKEEYLRISEYTKKGHISTIQRSIEYFIWKELQ